MPLAERMILAMEAGQAKGGDRRWGNLQSAAIKIADPNDPGRGGDYIALAIEVGEHAEPVGEMKRIYYTTQRRLGYRTFSNVDGPDVIELKRMLHALGYWRPHAGGVSGARRRRPTRRRCASCRRRILREYEKLIAESRRAVAGVHARLRTVRRRSNGRCRQVPRRSQARLPGQSGRPGRRAPRSGAARRVSGEKETARRTEIADRRSLCKGTVPHAGQSPGERRRDRPRIRGQLPRIGRSAP